MNVFCIKYLYMSETLLEKEPIQTEIAEQNTDAIEKTEQNTDDAVQNTEAENTDKNIENKDAAQKIDLDENSVTAWLKERGVLTDEATIDSLKPKVEKTEDEIKLEERAKNKEILDEYINSGGNAEDFVSIEKLTKVDEFELGLSAIRQQYKEAGFNNEKIEEIIKERHFQLTDEEIEGLDEDDQEEAKKNRQLYATQAKQLGEQLKQTATTTLNNLQKNIEARKVEAEIEISISGELDKFAENAKALNLKSIDSGTDAFKFDDLTLEYSKEEIAEVVNKLKDKSSREQIFYNNTNAAENVTFIAELMLRANKAEKAYQDGLMKGASSVNEFYKKTYLSSQNIQVRQQQPTNTGTGNKITPTGIKQIR